MQHAKSPGKFPFRFETLCAVLLAGLLAVAVWHYVAVFTPWRTTQRSAEYSQRLRDLDAMRQALDAYHAAHGSYPANAAFAGLVTAGGGTDPGWLPGLVPDYLPALPRDPARSNDANTQYLYRSDGRDYKLLAHGGGDCDMARKNNPGLVDPARDCWAYGYWTPGAAAW